MRKLNMRLEILHRYGQLVYEYIYEVADCKGGRSIVEYLVGWDKFF